MPRLRTRRLQLYTQLRQEHLTYREALDFSKMGKHRPPGSGRKAKAVFPPALRKIVQERRVMWQDFDKVATGRGWGSWRRGREWKGRIGNLYEGLSVKHKGNFFVTKNVHGKEIPRRLNPWSLYDAIYDTLPDDDKWDTPRSHRTHHPTRAPLKVEKRYKEKQLRADIKFYQQQMRETGDPQGEWKWKLDGARYQLRQGEY